ncbi:MAG: Flp pilus assembly complex ATPase component TadA [Candidatus Goldbacteria bacterium]|nr:Flp pilus assembly complex ATPase component TadA [Candidatus Goldiibacteriota bacterium]
MKKVLTLINGRAGAGKTTLAFNAAEYFASIKKHKSCVFEFEKDVNDFEAVYRNSEDFEKTKEAGMYKCRYTDLYCGFGGEAQLEKVLKDQSFKAVIIDTDDFPGIKITDISDRVIIPALLSQPDLRHAVYALDRLNENGYPANKVDIVVNRIDGSFLKKEDISGIFSGKEITGVLPYDKEVNDLQKKGRLLCGGKAKGLFCHEFKNIFDLIYEKCGDSGPKEFSSENLNAGANPAENSKPQLKDAKISIKKEVNRKLFEKIDLRKMEHQVMNNPAAKERFYADIKEKIKTAVDETGLIHTGKDRDVMVSEIFDEVTGLGAIQELLRDDDISEIMVNRHDKIYIEKAGKIKDSNREYTDSEAVIRAIERIVMPIGRSIDESRPYVDARLADGSRVNAVIPPLALDGPVITIRKFSKNKLSINDLVKLGSLTEEAADYLEKSVKNRKNILISGGTGSGKTTLLNVISSFIPADERIVTIEDSAELKLPQEHVVRLESRPANIEGRGEITIRDLVKNSLRMRPDRIVVGECRGGEALDMLQAMNTGHDGSITTVHANTPRDALSRVEVMVLMAGMDLPVKAIREQIKSAINIVIQQARFKDGKRRVTHISEITGMEIDTILMHNVFEFVKSADNAADGCEGELKRVDGIWV